MAHHISGAPLVAISSIALFLVVNLPVEILGNPPPPKGDPVFELKQLSNTLKYAYLGENKIYHVIISANLSEKGEEKLLKTLKKHRAAIGYTLDDLKGISPTLCQHKINLEADAKTSSCSSTTSES